jgi:hypothetical protein
MRGIKFLAGLGTIFVFAGIYCFKAAFHKQTFKEDRRNLHSAPVKNYGKGFLIFFGIVCFLLGILLILKSVSKIL